MAGLFKVDKLDMDILGGLTDDASISIPALAEKINSNTSVIYARVRRLVKNGIIERYTVVINEQSLGYSVKAHLGLSIEGSKRALIIETILLIDGVGGVSEVTGRFDILVTVYGKSLDDMHKLISEKIGKIDGVLSSETFIEMKTVKKYMPHTSGVK